MNSESKKYAKLTGDIVINRSYFLSNYKQSLTEAFSEQITKVKLLKKSVWIIELEDRQEMR